MLKWTAGLAAAGVVGLGVGYGASELLRPAPPVIVPPVELGPEATNPAQEIAYASVTNNGPRLTYVKDGRIIRSDSIPVPYSSSFPRFKVGNKTFNPPIKNIYGPVATAYRGQHALNALRLAFAGKPYLPPFVSLPA